MVSSAVQYDREHLLKLRAVLDSGEADIRLARDSVMREAGSRSRDALGVLHAELQVAQMRCRVKLLSTIPPPRTFLLCCHHHLVLHVCIQNLMLRRSC